MRTVSWPKEDFSRIPYAMYHDEDVYAREQERIFRGPTWNYLGLEAELPNPGDYITTVIGDTPIIVSRDQQGKVHAMVNRCMHRGATLRREAFGNAEDHTCVYHQWRFSLGGQLLSVPFPHGAKGEGGLPPDFDKSTIRLESLRVEIYKGVIFATFSDATEPLLEYLDAPVVAEIDRLFSKKIRILGYQRQRIFGNWKLYNDNVRDPNHGGLLHMFFATFDLIRLSQVGGAKGDRRHRHNISYSALGEETAGGQGNYGDTQKSSLTGYRLRDTSMLQGRREFPDRVTLVILSVFPGAVFQQISNSLCTRQIRTRGVNEMELYWTYFGYEDDDDSMTEHRLLQSNLCGPGGYISMEDGEAVEIVHKASATSQDAHARVEIGGVGEIRDSKNLISEMPVRGFWSYYHELMDLPGGASASAQVPGKAAA